ncbi:twin-arginine translocase TatA/TatE family subunit [Agarivorans gilvus]|jgi:sec-independent protein translocase protein TatA|uniref:Sec-independent protein translocase protein TatA n=1 Tax=Agarivorans gilvus TaxID=680279 RepID=A0ABQ1I6H3_9ALTE|nr:twin-arginine translocase TatA/TatE family subunit [Agarivorans gilvus]GGB18944.1 Sec-independent protein translocase protein TatA [Agarivorans gilvus]
MAGISIWQLAIIAVIVVLLFGTKRLRGLGGDLGTTIKGFKQAMAEDKDPEQLSQAKQTASANAELKQQQGS